MQDRARGMNGNGAGENDCWIAEHTTEDEAHYVKSTHIKFTCPASGKIINENMSTPRLMACMKIDVEHPDFELKVLSMHPWSQEACLVSRRDAPRACPHQAHENCPSNLRDSHSQGLTSLLSLVVGQLINDT